jgi:hypothetical protein
MKAFIVEGQMEQKIVRQLCPDVPVWCLHLNGKNAKTKAMALKAPALIKGQLKRNYPIFIIFDCEKRQETCEKIVEDFEVEMKGLGLDTNNIKIIVADRSTESWFYPFLRNDTTLSSLPLPSKVGEGRTTKNLVKDIFKRAGLFYSETDDGVRLFCALTPKEVRKISSSFEPLAQTLAEDCKSWFNES